MRDSKVVTKVWRKLDPKPQWAEQLGPPPRNCLFCGHFIEGHCLVGVKGDEDLQTAVKERILMMFSICDDCLEECGSEALPERIEAEFKRLTRVN